MVEPGLQFLHGRCWGYILGAYEVAYLEIEWNVL